MGETIGFIGLGTMGGPMAANLARRGFTVVGHDSSPGARAKAREVAGIELVDSAASVAARVPLLFTCLPNDEIVRDAYLGPAGVAEGARAGLLTCDCSTVSPEATLAVGAGLAARGVVHHDTPMLGSEPQAISGEIFFIVGGPGASLPRLGPALEAMGRLHMHVGPLGAGNRIKLVHNGLVAVTAVAVAEALATAASAGVDLDTLYEVVTRGGGMAHGTYFERRARRIVDREFAPTFMLQHMLKDATLALAHARGSGVPTPLLEETRRTYAEAADAGWAKEDFSAVTRVIERRTGRPVARGGASAACRG